MTKARLLPNPPPAKATCASWDWLNMLVIDHDKYPGNAAICAGPVSNQRRDIPRDLGHRDELVKSVLTGRGPNDVNARYHRIDTVPTVVACLLIRRSNSIIGGSDSIT